MIDTASETAIFPASEEPLYRFRDQEVAGSNPVTPIDNSKRVHLPTGIFPREHSGEGRGLAGGRNQLADTKVGTRG